MNNQNWNPQHPQPAQQMPPIPQSKSGMAIAGFVGYRTKSVSVFGC